MWSVGMHKMSALDVLQAAERSVSMYSVDRTARVRGHVLDAPTEPAECDTLCSAALRSSSTRIRLRVLHIRTHLLMHYSPLRAVFILCYASY